MNNTDFEVRVATLVAMGGDPTGLNTVFEVDKAILAKIEEGGGGITPVIVEELPATGESGKMYFVPNSDPGVQDNYKEYLWINNTWECVGNAAVDLTDYATKSWVEGKDYTTKTYVDGLVGNVNTVLEVIIDGEY